MLATLVLICLLVAALAVKVFPAVAGMLLFFGMLVLQAVSEIVLPGWFYVVAPGLTMVLTEIVIWTNADELSPSQKENVNTSVSVVIFAALLLTGQMPIEAVPDGQLLGDWIPYALAFLGYLWRGSRVVHDVVDPFKNLISRSKSLPAS